MNARLFCCCFHHSASAYLHLYTAIIIVVLASIQLLQQRVVTPISTVLTSTYYPGPGAGLGYKASTILRTVSKSVTLYAVDVHVSVFLYSTKKSLVTILPTLIQECSACK